MSVIDTICEKVQAGKRKEVPELVEQAIAEGFTPDEILNNGLMEAMTIIGDKFSRNEVFVPGMLVAARAMAAGTETLKPYMMDEDAAGAGKGVICTVKEDMHDIGKNLVRLMLEGQGFEMTDLGVDVDPSVIVDHLKQNPDCHLVCLSALLTTTMPQMENTIKAIEEAGLRDQVIIMVGGAPLSADFAEQIGADAYTKDAGEAAKVAVDLIKKFAA